MNKLAVPEPGDVFFTGEITYSEPKGLFRRIGYWLGLCGPDITLEAEYRLVTDVNHNYVYWHSDTDSQTRASWRSDFYDYQEQAAQVADKGYPLLPHILEDLTGERALPFNLEPFRE